MSPVDIEPSQEVQTARTVGVDRDRGHSLNRRAVCWCGYDKAARKAGAGRHSHGQERGQNSAYAEQNSTYSKEACRRTKNSSFPSKPDCARQARPAFRPECVLRPTDAVDHQRGIFTLEEEEKVAAD
jgi:hypothetical protein